MSFRKRNVVVSSPGGVAPPASAAEKNVIPGVRPSPIDGRPTTSTGTKSLDSLLGGHAGLPLGTSLLIEESGATDFSGALLRYYAAEGVLQGHSVHVLGVDDSWARELPGIQASSSLSTGKTGQNTAAEKMKIAWRYERLGEFGKDRQSGPQTSASSNDLGGQAVFCHDFDLSKRLTLPDPTLLRCVPMHARGGVTANSDGGMRSPFDGLLRHLVAQITSLPPGTVHRVVIPTILSPVAYPSVASDPRHVLQFLHAIRALLRRFPTQMTVMMSLPLSLYPRVSGLTRWLEILSDGVLELAPFPSHANLALATSVSGSTTLQEEPPQGILKVYELPILHEKGGGEHQGGHTDDLAFTLILTQIKFIEASVTVGALGAARREASNIPLDPWMLQYEPIVARARAMIWAPYRQRLATMEVGEKAGDLDHATTIYNLTLWTTKQLKSAANLTQYAPSAKDLLLAGPRMGMRLGSLFFKLPHTIDDALGARWAQSVAPEALNIGRIEASSNTAAMVGEMAQTGSAIMDDPANIAPSLTSKISLESGRSFGNMVAYATSRWSLGCFLMAIIVNRTQVYASTRRPLALGFRTRMALRALPIILLAIQARWLLQSIQCQTSPDFGMLRWGNATKSSELMFTQNGGPLHTMSTALLLGASDGDSCRAVRMIPPIEEDLADSQILNSPPKLSGSLATLWPLFQTLCVSQFVETLSCAVQGRHVASETGMTLFEHSLAFAEADAAISSSLGWGPFGGTPSKKNLDSHAKTFSDTSNNPGTSSRFPEIAISRSMIMQRINTPAEVLLIGFLSSMSHITSHILGIFNIQGRFRLLSTAFWGLCFMAMITRSIVDFSVDDASNQSLLRFPTVCIIGFIPHVMILAGILLCAAIYGFAILLAALAPPNGVQYQRRSFLRNLAAAHNNMQASVPLGNIRVSLHMDFYSALLKIGFSALTMASQAVYLNESLEVNIKHQTWLEDERLREIEETGAHWLGPNFRQGMGDGSGLVINKDHLSARSGYARERIAQDPAQVKPSDKIVRDGVGATERSGRWIMAFEFLAGIAKLIASWFAVVAIKVLARLGFRGRPLWLLWLVKNKSPTQTAAAKRDVRGSEPETLDFWLLNSEGELMLPPDDHVDVEVEMRRRLRGDNSRWSSRDEQQLDSNLYGWWLKGGWWGGDDNSGQFVPHNGEVEDDITSMISASDISTEQDWDSESDGDSGQRTPTQESLHIARELTPVPDTPLSSAELARLLNPQTPEQRAEAQTLAAHLGSDTIMTRSRYRDLHQREKAKVLMSTRLRPPHLHDVEKLTPEEESQLLEYLIVSRRRSSRNTTVTTSEPSSWAEGASGMGDGGPLCVVCQSTPRSIIVWPCRCLSLCDDCRVTLAMNNFDNMSVQDWGSGTQ
ncbi:hypothetical protein V494_04187 [Pseudogymnoascus sp. VKM F-4513 (FW-928)]|nr:hypothetical protein V494_04187 [Pseudogymnoascus sp. VKM F-4513 (FW-928)]